MDLELIIGILMVGGGGVLMLLRKFLRKGAIKKLEAKKFETLGRAIAEQYKLQHKQEADHLKRIQDREVIEKEENASDAKEKKSRVATTSPEDVLAMIRAENEALNSPKEP